MSRAQTLITENIATWTGAIQAKSTSGRGSSNKYELYGIKKLRELILELAVRGKLVPQDSSDEPASALLKRIAAEKTELIKAKKIKKPKALPPISDEEKPFELPDGWEWSRLQEVGHDWGQKIPDEEFTYIDVGAVNKEFGIIENPTILAPNDAPSRARKKVKQGTVIYSTVRPYLLNIAVIDKKIKPEPIASTAFAVVHPLSGMSAGFIYRYLRSPSFVEYVESCQTGVAYPAINDKQFFSGPIPVPPVHEQQRIVQKVDELMTLCDQLEQHTESSIEAHSTLVDTLLVTLSNSADADELQHSWARIAEHFDTLFTTERSIDALKQTILQLAVMGKLVRQNPDDEPASVLLVRIAAEKDRLVRNKKNKKPNLEFNGLEELKFTLPTTWEWVRLNDISDIVRGGSPRPAGDPKFYDGEIPFLKVADITRTSGKFVEEYNATIKEAGLKKTRYISERTLLLSNSGATLGIPAICEFPTTFNDGIAAFIEMTPWVFDEYLYLYLSSITTWFLKVASRGQGQPNLNTDIIKSTWFPLPPYTEQHRIVAKVDELMALCDQLKEKLRQSQQTQVHLTDAIVEQALA